MKILFEILLIISFFVCVNQSPVENVHAVSNFFHLTIALFSITKLSRVPSILLVQRVQPPVEIFSKIFDEIQHDLLAHLRAYLPLKFVLEVDWNNC